MLVNSTLAINGGQAVRQMPWPRPHITDEGDLNCLITALKQENWSNSVQVSKFEDYFSKYCGCKHALLVTNATAALTLLLRAYEIGPGDEVMIPGMTWPSIAIAIIESGATPIPVDIDYSNFGLSTFELKKCITSKTKAIIPTHLYCSHVDLASVLEIADENNLIVIEDSAHSVGAQLDGKPIGSFGHASIFSFNQKKLLSCGEGGCLVTNDETIYHKSKMLREIGDNPKILSTLPKSYKISEFQAAILLGQLAKLDSHLDYMYKNWQDLKVRLDNIQNIKVLECSKNSTLTPYNVCFKVSNIKNISWFRKALEMELGLNVSAPYLPLSECPWLTENINPRFKNLVKKLQVKLPNCIKAYYLEAVRFHHRVLFSDSSAINDIEKAVSKILNNYGAK